jgi:A/G-specific adenine glycosylase
MLQQTRVTAVLPYYERFLKRFPTVTALAEAPESEVLACWAGLGYYTRARNLQRAARSIQERGSFPTGHAEIRALPGVGDYTAAAVASIAFGLAHAVVDGNVLRVLSRLYADETDIALPMGRRHFAGLADRLLERSDPSDFNQALMELGATICAPKNPQCLVCPLQSMCEARRSGRQQDFPVKSPGKKQVSERRTVLWIERDGEILARQRGPEERLMAGFWELPERAHLPEATDGEVIATFAHSITFHNYRFDVVKGNGEAGQTGLKWLTAEDLNTLPLSTIFRKALRAVGGLKP